MAPPDLRLRVTSPGLLALPWDVPLGEWDATEVPLRDIPVGPSRHLVRFVETDGRLWALKELPQRVAAREYAVLRDLESMGLPAVRAAGLVRRAAAEPGPGPAAPVASVDDDNAVLVSRYLERSWQYRRLFMRLPLDRPRHRARLLDAMAGLLVDLHRNGVYWGDCSLANTLFSRDGQLLQAWLVDAETSEVHPELTAGQRRHDLDILVENVAGGMIDLALRLEQPADVVDALVDEAAGMTGRYTALWDALHAAPEVAFSDRLQIESRIRTLHDLGFAVDEVRLEPAGAHDRLRLQVVVAERRFHAVELAALTGLEVGEGQARILLGDLRAYQALLQQEERREVRDVVAARRWRDDLFEPGVERAHAVVGGVGDPVQAYCDLLEVRWLLSEQAGRDIGDEEALTALALRIVPFDAAATMAVADAGTDELLRLTPAVLAYLDKINAVQEEERT
jgi:Domain of unknown function (DUF4032)/Lipopolysaccharide kinase (Kdo/WaaP) family